MANLAHSTRITEVITKPSGFNSAGDLYAALAYATLDGVELDNYEMPRQLWRGDTELKLERIIPDAE